MQKNKFIRQISLIVFILLSACTDGRSPNVTLAELSNNVISYDDIVRINNCGGKADSEQTQSRAFATTFEGGAELSAGYKAIAEGSVSAKYSQYRNITKSQRLIAPPGTNMEFVIRWSEEVRAGNVTVDGSTGDYEVRIPISVEQISSQDLGNCLQNIVPNSNEQSTPVTTLQTTPNSPSTSFSKGNLIYECDFAKACEWNIETGNRIENSTLFVSPGYDATLGSTSLFTNFVLEARFLLPLSGSMSFYVHHQRPACKDWNCSIQIGIYDQEVVARRFLGDKSNQQIDILKNKSVTSFRSNEWNTIVIVAQENNYRVYMNDVLALEFTDDTYRSGSFIIDNAIDSIAEVKIDYFRVFTIQ